jgi:hypothetical protein
MDHHCPWIGSCVGFYNHANFFRFLVWTEMTSAAFLGTCIYKFYDMMDVYALVPLGTSVGRWSLFQVMINLFNIVLLAIVFIAVGFMIGQHLFGFMKNMTLIERLEMQDISTRIDYLKRRRDPLALKFMGKRLYPYDLGIARNLDSFLGEARLLRWFFPVSIAGNGMHFQVADWVIEAAEANAKDDKPFLIEWPPRLDDDYEAENIHESIYEQDEEGYIIPDNSPYPVADLPSPRSLPEIYTQTYPSRNSKSVDWYLRKTAQMQRSKTANVNAHLTHSSVSLARKPLSPDPK